MARALDAEPTAQQLRQKQLSAAAYGRQRTLHGGSGVGPEPATPHAGGAAGGPLGAPGPPFDIPATIESILGKWMDDYPAPELIWLELSYQHLLAEAASPDLSASLAESLMARHAEAAQRCAQFNAAPAAARCVRQLFHNISAGDQHTGSLLDQLARYLMAGIEHAFELCAVQVRKLGALRGNRGGRGHSLLNGALGGGLHTIQSQCLLQAAAECTALQVSLHRYSANHS